MRVLLNGRRAVLLQLWEMEILLKIIYGILSKLVQVSAM
jgi:hypothetical protein